MTDFYVGRCKGCGNPVAAAIKEYADGDDVKAMIDSDLSVEIERHMGLRVIGCACK